MRAVHVHGAVAKHIAEHSHAEILRDILHGKKFTTGTMPVSESDSVVGPEPRCVEDLNNFHAYFHGGVYRDSRVFKNIGVGTDQSHLSILLHVLARELTHNGGDLTRSLAGHSHRYLSESPEELWRNIDEITKRVTGSDPGEFGELFREIQQSLFRLRVTLDFEEESRNVGSGEDPNSNAPLLVDPVMESMQSRMQAYWDRFIEPHVMVMYEELIGQGYTKKDLWT